MRIRFLRDFRGHATNEQFYEAGTTVDLDSAIAQACIAEGAAVVVPLVAREGQASPKQEAPQPRQRGRRG